MILNKPNALVYVHRGGLIVAGKRIEYSRLLFPSDLVSNLEVQNTTKLIELCRQFFTEKGLEHKRVLMVLDNDLIFGKKIDLDSTGKPDALTEAFVEAMPFDEGKRACLAIQTGGLLQLLGTNAGLYQDIAEALNLCGITKLFAITPVAAYDLSGTDRKVSSLTDHFLKNAEAARLVDFSSTDPL